MSAGLLLAAGIGGIFVGLTFLPARRWVFLIMMAGVVALSAIGWFMGHPYETYAVPFLFVLAPATIYVGLGVFFDFPRWVRQGVAGLYLAVLFLFAWALEQGH